MSLDAPALALVSVDAFESTDALLEALPVTAIEPEVSAPVLLEPETSEPVLVVEPAPVQSLAEETEICGVPEASTLTFTLYAALLPASTTLIAAVEDVVDVALACTPALALRSMLNEVKAWVAASVAMCSVASDVPLRSNDVVNDPLPLATVVTEGPAATFALASAFALVPAFTVALSLAQLVAEGPIESCVVPEAALVRPMSAPVPAKAVPVMPRARAVPAIKMAVRGKCISTPLIAKGRVDLSTIPVGAEGLASREFRSHRPLL